MSLTDTYLPKPEIFSFRIQIFLILPPQGNHREIALDFIYICNRWPENYLGVLNIQVLIFQEG